MLSLPGSVRIWLATAPTDMRLGFDGLAARVEQILVEIQKNLFDRAVKFREEHTTTTDSYEEFKATMEGRPGFVISPWCGERTCEAEIKADTQATIRNLPFDGPPATGTCLKCGKPAVAMAYFAKSY